MHYRRVESDGQEGTKMCGSITQDTAMKTNIEKKAVSCPVEQTLEIIGGRWKVLVIHELLEGTRRFSELQRALIGVSHRTLTQQLRELEQAGIVRREVFGEVPPKVEYSLTPLGRSMQPVLMAMHQWAVDHAGEFTNGRI
jgi:DNA-binding HxlR family transcriptional regulator